ncbi:MAG TPA: hypothetical protein VM581_01420 [Magnetospirillaceae bacterium]|nr:hypothetical protein [Magnetospirillaceae bacterium]
MNKDVIYIDIEDDITAIIGKVKDAGSKIVALVPPKRAGVLQSLVNLKLLKKAADAADKRIVLITSDHSLTALAAGLKMPIAKNLQSRPEVPEMTAPEVDEEEVINGADLPVGEVASAMAAGTGTKTLADTMSKHVDLKDAPKASELATEPVKKPGESLAKKMSGLQSKLKIPDFTTFRNKFFLFGGIGVLVVGFLVWALAFAPHATIKISAQTVAVNVDQSLTLDPKTAASDPAKMILKPNVQQLKKSVATTFEATGKKDIGNKASGTITITNCDSNSSFILTGGTTFTAPDGHKFTSNAQETIPGFTGSASACRNGSGTPGTKEVAVTAIDLGDEYNVAPAAFTISGLGGDIYARSGAAMVGGSHQMATVVSQEDVDKAKAQIVEPSSSDIKNDLKKQFVGDFLVIEDSFTSEPNTPAVEPAVGQPAQQAKITIETTYSYVGISRDDIKTIATGTVNTALQGRTDQQMYSLGDNSATFQSFRKLEGGTFTGRVTTTAYIGPKIDTKALAQQITGKRFGEIQTIVNQIPGVNKVDIDLSPFWVNTAPSVDKIDISFTVANGL